MASISVVVTGTPSISTLPALPDTITTTVTEQVTTLEYSGVGNNITASVLGSAGPKGDTGPEGPMSSQIFVTRELITGTRDGTNMVFSIANIPILDSETLFLNGLALFPGNDYTIIDADITALIPVFDTDLFWTSYRY